jgi:hypothetical protein
MNDTLTGLGHLTPRIFGFFGSGDRGGTAALLLVIVVWWCGTTVI